MIKLTPVNIGSRKINIPVAQIRGKKEGKHLLITAGADGDEYAGIEAAYQLAEKFQTGNFCGNLTIIPTLNIPGFEKGTGINPLDGKYPKHIFPGKKDGSASERLIHWLTENHLYSSTVWLDLHGGGIAEILDPYVYLYETKNKEVNEIVKKLLMTIDAPKIVFERPGVWSKVDKLAQKRIAYLITEAGYSGERKKKWIDQHISWTMTVMRVLGMINNTHTRVTKPRIYRKISKYRAKHTGFWNSSFNRHLLIVKGQTLGRIYSDERTLLNEVIARESGEYLWMKQNLFSQKNETLIEVGY